MGQDMQDYLHKILMAKGNIRLESQSENEYSLYIYGAIGGFFGSNSARSVQRELSQVKAKKIHVHINSGGGSAFDGIAISNLLKNHKAEIIVHIDGIAASAASIIAMAGDKVIMPSNTMMMIHRAATFAFGNASDFEKVAEDLNKIDAAVTASYETRFVGTREELVSLLEKETFLTANEAVTFGFADEVAEEIDIPEVEEEEESGEVENSKEGLLQKYAAQARVNKPGEPETKNLLSRFQKAN